MKNEPYVHLHCHTGFSVLDGAMSPEQLVDRAADLGMESVAITDHGFLSGLPSFQRAALKRGLKPILGVEAYIVDSVARAKGESDRKRFHQVILVKDQVGLENLYRLMSWGSTEGFYYRPLIDLKKLEEFRDGLVVTSSCMQGYANQTFLGGQGTPGFEQSEAQRISEAYKIHRHYLDLFGEDYYLEVHRHGIEEEDKIALFLQEVGSKLGIPIISANDCHYVEEGDYNLQDALVCVGTNQRISNKDRMQIAHKNLHIKSGQEMVDLFPEFPKSAENTLLLAEKCNSKIVFHGDEGNYLFPHFPIPKNFQTPMSYLRHICDTSYGDRYPRALQEEEYGNIVKGRLSYELGVIEKMGLGEYFLIVQDITREARKMGIPVGPGRGSAAGSAVSYVLGITDLDPIHHKLLFERFLNEGRMSMPDVDIDVSDDGRQEVIAYIRKKYGEERVCQIVAFSTLGAASGIQNFGRVLQVPFSETNALTKKIPEDPKMRAKSLDVLALEIDEIGALKDSRIDEERKMYEYTVKAHNFPRHTSVHAAGVLITPEETEKFVPKMLQSKTKTVTTQYDGSLLDSLGLVKMDILGLKTLSVIKDARDLIRAKDSTVDLDLMYQLDDPLVYQTVFAPGDTIGVFQLESPGMRRWLRDLRPTEFNDIVAMTSLYRPGPMDLIPSYVERKNGREEVTYLHPCLEEVLGDTYGIPIYQEEVMEMAQVVAGYSLSDADLLRRAMGKKKPEEMRKQRAIFQRGALKTQGIEKELADEIFDTMEKFSGYGFNRSHAAAYSVLSYAQAWILTYYPVEYFASTLQRSKFEDVSSLVDEIRNRGITLLPPDINRSEEKFLVEMDQNGVPGIRYGIGMLKGVGAEAQKIIKKRPRNGYASYTDFLDRCIPRQNVAETLVRVGALDSLEGKEKRAWMDINVIPYLKWVREVQKKRYGKRKSDPAPVEFLDPYQQNEKQVLFNELNGAGCFFSGHPLGIYEKLLDLFPPGVTYATGGKQVQAFVGTVMDLVGITTKRGLPMWFLRISTGGGEVKFALFDGAHKRFGSHLSPEKNVIVFASEYLGEFSTIEAILPVEHALQDMVSHIHISVDTALEASRSIDFFDREGPSGILISIKDDDYELRDTRISVTQESLQRLEEEGISYSIH